MLIEVILNRLKLNQSQILTVIIDLIKFIFFNPK